MAEPLADNITEEVWTNGGALPVIGDGGDGVVLIPHEEYRDMNVANLKARAVAVTMYAASALAAGPEEDYFSSAVGSNLYIRRYSESMVEEALDLLHATDFQPLESLEILGDINVDDFLLNYGISKEEVAEEVSRIISAYGAQDARLVAVAFEIPTHGRYVVIMYAVQYQDRWYLLGPSRGIAGTTIGLKGIVGIKVMD